MRVRGLVSETPCGHLEAVLLARAWDPARESWVAAPLFADPPLDKVSRDQRGKAGTQQGRRCVEQQPGAGGTGVTRQPVCSGKALVHICLLVLRGSGLWVEVSAQVCRC